MIREKSHDDLLDYLKNLDKEPASNKVELTKAAFVKKPVTPVSPTEGVVDSTCGSEASTIEVGNRTLILSTPVGQSAGELKMDHLFPNSNPEVHTNQNETPVSSTSDLKTKHPTQSPVLLIRESSDSLFKPVVKLDSNSPRGKSNENHDGQKQTETKSKFSSAQAPSNPKNNCCGCFSRWMQCCGVFRRGHQKTTIQSKETARSAEQSKGFGNNNH